MKENIDQLRMLPTQSGNGMYQVLDGVRKAARERKQERFISLPHYVTTPLLRASFYAFKRQASPIVPNSLLATFNSFAGAVSWLRPCQLPEAVRREARPSTA